VVPALSPSVRATIAAVAIVAHGVWGHSPIFYSLMGLSLGCMPPAGSFCRLLDDHPAAVQGRLWREEERARGPDGLHSDVSSKLGAMM